MSRKTCPSSWRSTAIAHAEAIVGDGAPPASMQSGMQGRGGMHGTVPMPLSRSARSRPRWPLPPWTWRRRARAGRLRRPPRQPGPHADVRVAGVQAAAPKLKAALAVRMAEAEHARTTYEDAVALAERARPAAEKLPGYRVNLDDLTRVEEQLRSRDKVLAAEQQDAGPGSRRSTLAWPRPRASSRSRRATSARWPRSCARCPGRPRARGGEDWKRAETEPRAAQQREGSGGAAANDDPALRLRRSADRAPARAPSAGRRTAESCVVVISPLPRRSLRAAAPRAARPRPA